MHFRSAMRSPCSIAAAASHLPQAEITRERVLELMAGGKELADLTTELEELARTSA